MPDFERFTDQLRVDMARTPDERAHAEGFIAGKRYARLQIAYTAAFLAVVAVFLAVLLAA